MNFKGIEIKRINLISVPLVMALILGICSLFSLRIGLYIPTIFSSHLMSLFELLWAFAILNLSLWILYKLIDEQFLSRKISNLQIVIFLIATVSFCTIEGWGRLFIHTRRYILISKLGMLTNSILLKGLIIVITILFFVSVFLFLFNVMIGFIRRHVHF